MVRSVLLIDDDPGLLGMLEQAFRRAGYSVTAAATGEVGVDAYTRDATDLVVLDLNLPDIGGLDVLAQLRSVNPDVTVIVLTAQADLPTAVEAMRGGAENFLAKPVDIAHLYAAADRAYEKTELRRRALYLETRDRDRDREPVTEGQPAEMSTMMAQLNEKVALIAPRDTTVLLLGETGTGKTWIARRIHDLSKRAKGPFVEVNAASLTSTFLDSELFGHEKGAFTDAKAMKRGLLEVADGGTLFLDEIGDLAPELQPKFLHVLETGHFRRIGGTRELESDVRIIAATNKKLEEAVRNGTFREDLYYRLAVVPLVMPPLRDRSAADVAALAQDQLDRLQLRITGRRKTFSEAALGHITGYKWPGNIRELRNVLERALILAGDSASIEPAHLPAELTLDGGGRHQSDSSYPVDLTLHDLEKQHIQRVLEHTGGNRSRTARVLGISRVGLYKKMHRLDLDS